jgi:hypothetical protein
LTGCVKRRLLLVMSDQCGHDYLLAYSCKTRYFCPSCHQKRMLAYSEWLEENLLERVRQRGQSRNNQDLARMTSLRGR